MRVRAWRYLWLEPGPVLLERGAVAGMIHFDPATSRYSINSSQMLSIIVAEYPLQEVLAARPYMCGRLVDIGCGTRRYRPIYEPLVTECYGTEVEFSPFGTGEADLICLAESLPFVSGSIDTVLMTEVLGHTTQPMGAFPECARVLRCGGHLILSVPFIYPLRDWPHDYWRFTRYGPQVLSQANGLAPVYMRIRGGIGGRLVSLATQIVARLVDGLNKLPRHGSSLRNRRLAGC
jgi:SAM-dependent methyltransferase